MQEVGAADGADGYGVFGNPIGAPLGQGFLLQRVVGLQSPLGKFKRLGFVGAGVQVFHGVGISKQEPDVAYGIQFFCQ